MLHIEWNYFFNDILLVIAENFEVKISKQVEIYFVSVIADTHHAGTMLMNQANLLIK